MSVKEGAGKDEPPAIPEPVEPKEDEPLPEPKGKEPPGKTKGQGDNDRWVPPPPGRRKIVDAAGGRPDRAVRRLHQGLA